MPPRLVAVDVDGTSTVTFAVDLSWYDPIADIIAAGDLPTSPANELWRHLVQSGSRVLDVGAHIGTYSLPAAALGAEVIAVEASGPNAALLKLAAERNGFDRLKVVEAVAGGNSGAVGFRAAGPWGQVLFASELAEGDGVTKSTVALEDLLRERRWDEVDVIKMDIEGSECDALRGLRTYLARQRVKVLIVESNGHALYRYGCGPSDVVAALEAHGYRCCAIESSTRRLLRPVTAGDLQPQTEVDYIAFPEIPPELPPWSVGPPLDRREVIRGVIETCTGENVHHRQYGARLLARAPEWLLQDPEVAALRRSLEIAPRQRVQQVAQAPGHPEWPQTIVIEPRCFMHVPKSGGLSVHAALEAAFTPETLSRKRMDTLMFCGGFRDFESLSESVRVELAVGEDEMTALASYGVISGHFALSSLLGVTRASAIATVLRGPRARLLSHYAYWRLLPRSARRSYGSYQALDYAQGPLDEFLSEPMVARASDNLLCRMLLSDDARIPEVGFIPSAETGSVARDAIEVLATLGYVGILELGEELWEGLSRFFGIPLTPAFVNDTASHADAADAPATRRPITSKTLGLLGARTAADRAVYQHALVAAGRSAEDADYLEATAFAAELVKIGNVLGESAAAARSRGIEVRQLACQLESNDHELQRAAASLSATREQLEQEEDLVEQHRTWLVGMEGSASWRLTAPLRAGKRQVTRLRASRRPR